MAPSSGQIVGGKLRLLRTLGRGNMGSVWLADHVVIGAKVAIKFLDPKGRETDETLMERFKSEASLAAKLRCPHIVQVLDHGVHDDSPYIVMELLEGLNLGDWLERRGPMSPHDTAKVLEQVAQALERSHAAGVIHRDLKPDNLFHVDGSYDIFVKVLDFGVAKHPRGDAVASLTETHAVVGTPHYMSPEQLASGKQVDYRTDLWALAIVCYELMSGRVPFTAQSFVELYREVTRGIFVPITEVLGEAWTPLDRWFETALAIDKAERFQSAQAMAKGFRAALAQVPEGTPWGEDDVTLAIGTPAEADDERPSPQDRPTQDRPTRDRPTEDTTLRMPAGVPARPPIARFAIAAAGFAAVVAMIVWWGGPTAGATRRDRSAVGDEGRARRHDHGCHNHGRNSHTKTVERSRNPNRIHHGQAGRAHHAATDPLSAAASFGSATAAASRVRHRSLCLY